MYYAHMCLYTFFLRWKHLEIYCSVLSSAASMLLVYFWLDDTYEKRWKLWVYKFLIVGNSTWITLLCHTVWYKINPQLNTIDHCMIMFIFITLTVMCCFWKISTPKSKHQGVQKFGANVIDTAWQSGILSLTKGRSTPRTRVVNTVYI